MLAVLTERSRFGRVLVLKQIHTRKLERLKVLLDSPSCDEATSPWQLSRHPIGGWTVKQFTHFLSRDLWPGPMPERSGASSSLPWILRSTCSASDLALIPATAPWVFPHANRGYASAACALSVLRFTALHHFFSIYNILFSRPDPVGLVKPRLHGNNLELQPVLFGKGAFLMNERASVAAPSTAANNSVQMDTFLVAGGLVVAHQRAVLLALALTCRRRLMAGRP